MRSQHPTERTTKEMHDGRLFLLRLDRWCFVLIHDRLRNPWGRDLGGLGNDEERILAIVAVIYFVCMGNISSIYNVDMNESRMLLNQKKPSSTKKKSVHPLLTFHPLTPCSLSFPAKKRRRIPQTGKQLSKSRHP